MRNRKNNKLTTAICIFLALLVTAPPLLAYPPDNAALLYYQACLCYKTDAAMQSMLKDFLEGKIEVNDNIKEYIRRNHAAIESTVTAADVQHCDWGLDYSEGLSMMLPHLSYMQNLSRLLTAEAKAAAADGNYELALDRCLSVLKTSGHIGDDLLVSYLMAVAHAKMAKKCVQGILSQMPPDLEILTWFKNDLTYVTGRAASARAAVKGDARISLADMRVEKAEEIALSEADEGTASDLEKLAAKRLRAGGEEFFERNRDYFKNYMAAVGEILDGSMPYVKAYKELKSYQEKLGKDANKNADATLTILLAPAVHHVYNREIESKTFLNAIKSALEIYISKAKTGKLPNELPAGLPKDLFSGKDFQYEKKDDGFVLRCKGKNLDKDEIHHYEFKVSR